MKHLSSLFDRYKKTLVPPQASVEKRAAELLSEFSGLPVKQEQVSYSVASKTISLQVPSILKSELQHHKTALLERLQSEMGVTNAPKTII